MNSSSKEPVDGMVQLARSRAEEFMVRERGGRLLLSEEKLVWVDVCCDDGYCDDDNDGKGEQIRRKKKNCKIEIQKAENAIHDCFFCVR